MSKRTVLRSVSTRISSLFLVAHGEDTFFSTKTINLVFYFVRGFIKTKCYNKIKTATKEGKVETYILCHLAAVFWSFDYYFFMLLRSG